MPNRTFRLLLALAVCLPLLASAQAADAVTLVAFDFENASDGDPTAAASATGPGISGALFDGTKNDSQVSAFSTNVFTSSALDPQAGGSFFSFFSFTTSSAIGLNTLSFTAGQNDLPTGTSNRDFEILLSPVDATAPATGDRTGSLAGYTLLDTIGVPYGFATGAPNFAVDLSGTSLTPGTYHVAFALDEALTLSTTQLFLDNVVLTPEPSTALLLVGGLAGLAAQGRKRRLH